MQRCPVCGESRGVMPLMQAVKRDSTLWTSEFSWMMEPQWGRRPPVRAPIGTRRVADQVFRQLTRPVEGVSERLRQVVGVLLGIAAAFVGIPLFIIGLLLLTSMNVLLLPVFLVLWLVTVVLLVAWGKRSHATPTAYRKAVARMADLSYCSECDSIFDSKSGLVVSVDRLHEDLHAEGLRTAGANYLARRS